MPTLGRNEGRSMGQKSHLSSILLLALWTLLAAPAINPGALANAQGCFMCTVHNFLWYAAYVLVCAGVSVCMLLFPFSAGPFRPSCANKGWHATGRRVLQVTVVR